jgi:hypothetical protein
VNAINEMCGMSDRHHGLMIEALYTIPLTPSVETWRENFKSVAALLDESCGVMEKNFYLSYIDFCLERTGSVSVGKDPRCQPSQRGSVTLRQSVQSMQNLCQCLEMANETNDTKRVIGRMSKSAKNGGVHGVGPFWAHVLLNLATKLGLVRNHVHIQNVSVAPSTATFKRLKKTYGVRTRAHAAEIVPYLASRNKISAQSCENRLCEVLRAMHGKDDIVDVFFVGDVLYKVRGGLVLTVDISGREMIVQYEQTQFGDGYMPNVAWWDDGLVFGKDPHMWDESVIRLKTAKRGKRGRD